jgi:uracil-DNA glycosylase
VDPIYHGNGEANGLCFSVNDGIRIPRRLCVWEMSDDLGTVLFPTSNLDSWATQGVLLLNTTLTV